MAEQAREGVSLLSLLLIIPLFIPPLIQLEGRGGKTDEDLMLRNQRYLEDVYSISMDLLVQKSRIYNYKI
jgi:hypothetical protein